VYPEATYFRIVQRGWHGQIRRAGRTEDDAMIDEAEM